MTNRDRMIEQMAGDLRIDRVKGEWDASFQKRVLYSACTMWTTCALWEHEDITIPETDEPPKIPDGISRAHVHQRVCRILRGYSVLFPAIQEEAERAGDTSALDMAANELINTLVDCGSCYTRPFRLFPLNEARISAYGVEWIRAPYPGGGYAMSGAGAYLPNPEIESPEAFGSFFRMNTNMPGTLVERLKLADGWTSPASAENFISITPEKAPVSVRYRHTEVSREYWLFNGAHMRRFQDWEVSEGLHLMAALALGSPVARINGNRHLIHIWLSRLLPKRESAFFRLYSWPKQFSTGSDGRNFEMSGAMLPAARSILMKMNYHIEEHVE